MDFLQSSLQRFGCTDGLTETEEVSPLLKCPDLIIWKLLDYLTPNDLKILRLTCKTTKSWVEEPNILKRLQVIINGNKKRMKELLKSRVFWNNLSFIISQNSDSPKKLLRFYSSRYLYSSILKKFGPHLKIIHVDSIVSPTCVFGPPDFLQEIGQCKNFLELESMSIDLLQFRDGCRPEFEKMQVFLKGMELKHLRIKEIDDYEYDLEGKSTFFEDILFSCNQLVELDLPCRIAIPWKKRHESNERENVLLPVIKYLRKQISCQKKSGLVAIRLSHYSKAIPLKTERDQCPLLQELNQVCLLNQTTLIYSN